MRKKNNETKTSGEKARRQKKSPAATMETMTGAPTAITKTVMKKNTRKKNVTLADIARRAGVSTAAVSFTLAGRLDMALAETTRNRIKQCAKELGYIPNRLSEGFSRGRSRLIGVLIISDSYRPFLDCIAGIHETLARSNCFPLLMSTDWIRGHWLGDHGDDEEQKQDALADLHHLLEYQVDGILYVSLSAHEGHTIACAKELAARKIPMILMGGVDPTGGEIDTVGGDNKKTGLMVAEHLLSLGCTSFIHVTPENSHPLHNAIHASFAARLKAAGHTCNLITMDVEKPPKDMGGLLSRLARHPVGIFCTRDDIAALSLRVVLELGWRVPRDAAVVAMGQARTALPRFNSLPITVLERHSFTAGKEAAKLLLRRIDGYSGRPQHIFIPPSLEVRASSMPGVSRQLLVGTDSPAPRSRTKKRG